MCRFLYLGDLFMGGEPFGAAGSWLACLLCLEDALAVAKSIDAYGRQALAAKVAEANSCIRIGSHQLSSNKGEGCPSLRSKRQHVEETSLCTRGPFHQSTGIRSTHRASSALPALLPARSRWVRAHFRLFPFYHSIC